MEIDDGTDDMNAVDPSTPSNEEEQKKNVEEMMQMGIEAYAKSKVATHSFQGNKFVDFNDIYLEKVSLLSSESRNGYDYKKLTEMVSFNFCLKILKIYI